MAYRRMAALYCPALTEACQQATTMLIECGNI